MASASRVSNSTDSPAGIAEVDGILEAVERELGEDRLIAADVVGVGVADAALRLELVQILADESGVVLVDDARLLVAREGM